jgi:hypothetical protein
VNNQFENNQLPHGNSTSSDRKQLPIEVVDELACELAREYRNDVFLKWYCGIIYQFGLATVHEWRTRAAEGNEPAKLFSKYVRDARMPRRDWRAKG